MSDRELKLNSLSRYVKQSPDFVLEEQGSCEVPAGCGGVVLRWTNPRIATPLTLWLVTDGTAEVFLDGVAPSSARPMVNHGSHALAFKIASPGILKFAAMYEERTRRERRSEPASKTMLMSKPDGSWKATRDQPSGDSWMLPEFDDSTWRPLVSRRLEESDAQKGYRYRELAKHGAEDLGLDGVGPIWVRRPFTLQFEGR